jgi:hypothetical protein
MGVGDQRHASAALPPGKTPGIHYVQGWEGRRSGRLQKMSPPPGIDPRKYQPVG